MNCATIITDDTLQAIGLKHILITYFDIDAFITTDTQNLEASDSQSTIYFTSATRYISLLDFFMPRRTRTIILSTRDILPENTSIDTSMPLSQLLDAIKAKIEQLRHKQSQPMATLSQREIDVLRLVATGLINKEIAERLNISFNTVLSHRKNITAKLGIRSVSGLSVYAIMNGYISDDDLIN